MTVWFAFQVYQQHAPTPDDIIFVAKRERSVIDRIRERAESKNLLMTTTNNPAFQYEFRRSDNTIHSYIAVKELPLFD